jgi:hypothetical protein
MLRICSGIKNTPTYASKRTRKTSTGRHRIGFYKSEEEAAVVDHARAVFKYGGKKQRSKDVVDPSGIPPQPSISIPKSAGRKDGASKYAGIDSLSENSRRNGRHESGLEERNEPLVITMTRRKQQLTMLTQYTNTRR